jgi:hypothetical protein
MPCLNKVGNFRTPPRANKEAKPAKRSKKLKRGTHLKAKVKKIYAA